MSKQTMKMLFAFSEFASRGKIKFFSVAFGRASFPLCSRYLGEYDSR